jgi:hypothetical protein
MALRGRRPRRWTDRIEDAAAWMLLAAGLLLILAGCAIGLSTHDRLAERGRLDALDRTPAVAVLLEATPTIAYGGGSPVGASATWRDRWGQTHTGIVTAPQSLRAGSAIPIWIDRSGAAVPAPTSDADAVAVATFTAGVVILAGVSVLACVWEIVRRVTLAHNCAAWEREWREVAPVWSRGAGR